MLSINEVGADGTGAEKTNRTAQGHGRRGRTDRTTVPRKTNASPLVDKPDVPTPLLAAMGVGEEPGAPDALTEEAAHSEVQVASLTEDSTGTVIDHVPEPATVDTTAAMEVSSPAPTVILPFTYDGMSEKDAAIVRTATETIRARLESTKTDMMEIGRQLIAAKAALPHGAWLPWLAEVDVPDRTAQQFMKCAGSAKSEIVAHLTPTAVIRLVSTRPEVRAVIEERIAAGERITAAEIVRMDKAAKAAKVVSPEAMAKAAAKAEKNDLAAELEIAIAGSFRERVAKAATNIAALSTNVAEAAAKAAKAKARGTKECTKTWSNAAADAADEILAEVRRLTGRSYCRHPSGVGDDLAVQGRINDLLAVIWDLRQRCAAIREFGQSYLKADELGDWAGRFGAAM